MPGRTGVYLSAIAAAGLFALASNPLAASSPATAETVARILALEGDPAYGEYLGSECATCHRRGAGSAGIPQITGMTEEDFVIALVEYREGIRTNEVMRTTASRLSDEEIAALAAHFAEPAPQ